jgi:hypothetical protein
VPFDHPFREIKIGEAGKGVGSGVEEGVVFGHHSSPGGVGVAGSLKRCSSSVVTIGMSGEVVLGKGPKVGGGT